MLNLCMIAAVGNNFELGKNNQLLCHLPADLKRFKEITSGFPVIMGDKTWESLPIKPLPNRRNIVITLDKNFIAESGKQKAESTHSSAAVSPSSLSCEIVHTIDDAIALVKNEEKAFIIGGATIYKLFIDKIDTLYLTRIDANFDADVFFPNVDFNEWNLVEEVVYEKDEKNGFGMRFQVYKQARQADSVRTK
ncbi:MAG: dihydrofolate reductase [Bacteroidetes bacterium]|nr:dihydrofolate reductase [Bacteroidota bacterium]MCL1969138.1 dihydrofolate reductase [Bacteroidota bacterium]